MPLAFPCYREDRIDALDPYPSHVLKTCPDLEYWWALSYTILMSFLNIDVIKRRKSPALVKWKILIQVFFLLLLIFNAWAEHASLNMPSHIIVLAISFNTKPYFWKKTIMFFRFSWSSSYFITFKHNICVTYHHLFFLVILKENKFSMFLQKLKILLFYFNTRLAIDKIPKTNNYIDN